MYETLEISAGARIHAAVANRVPMVRAVRKDRENEESQSRRVRTND
jgi:hypothetical protein